MASPADSDSTGPWSYRAFGLDLECDRPLLSHLAPPGGGPPDLRIVTRGPVEEIDFEALAPVYASDRRVAPEEESISYLYRPRPGLEVIRYSRVVDFHLEETTIQADLRDPALEHLVEIRLLGTVLAYWLERRGCLALHAAALRLGDGVVGLLGTNGSGKTTLAAAALAAGHRLVSDDLLALEVEGAGVTARPGYPQMRLWPDQAERFFGTREGLGRAHPDYDKLRLAVGGQGQGAFEAAARPLDALYLLEREEESGQPPRIEAVPRAAAVIELLRHSFAPHIASGAGLEGRRLERAGRVVEAVPVRRLLYPSGFSHLETVLEVLSRGLERP